MYSVAVHVGEVAGRAPARPAVVMASTGETVTFSELNERSNRLGHLFRDLGLRPRSTVAILVENHPRFMEVVWAAQRSGLYYTAINTHLSAPEAAYIATDCGAEVIIGSAHLSHTLAELDSRATPGIRDRLLIGGRLPGWQNYEDAVAGEPGVPLDDECEGDFMLYSSGTTGRPKGIQRPLELAPMGHGIPGAVPFLQALGLQDGGVYLTPAPLYHAAPLAWSLAAQRLGATVVVMERFDPVEMLRAIEQYRVTHVQVVPTMFVRMLKLSPAERGRFDLSSLVAAVHAAAPCPVDIKRQMIEWWGPIIYEYYSATEGIGATFIDSKEWLSHPGSVGRPMMGQAHIVDEDGTELPAGQVGTIYFSGGNSFEYHNDPDQTEAAKDGHGWATVGDVGYLDEDGYLYLTDRKTFMIISGGVNIYPQETEDVLVGHPKVMDAAVIGVPSSDLGEEVKAIVQPVDWDDAGDALAEELMDYCRSRISLYKCPRSIDFEPELPRLDSGKLYKRLLRDRYWGEPSK